MMSDLNLCSSPQQIITCMDAIGKNDLLKNHIITIFNNLPHFGFKFDQTNFSHEHIISKWDTYLYAIAYANKNYVVTKCSTPGDFVMRLFHLLDSLKYSCNSSLFYYVLWVDDDFLSVWKYENRLDYTTHHKKITSRRINQVILIITYLYEDERFNNSDFNVILSYMTNGKITKGSSIPQDQEDGKISTLRSTIQGPETLSVRYVIDF